MKPDSETKDESVRTDVWIWAVRLFKTRSQAGDACKKNQVMVNGQSCKPARQLRVGDRVEVTKGDLVRTVEVKALLSKRVGAKVVEDYLVDHTPQEAYDKAAEIAQRNRDAVPKRDPGQGRPTKRERRELDEIMVEAEENESAFRKFAKAFGKRRKK